MRLPNKYGSVYKLSGKRRRPWTARIKVGMNVDFDRQKAWAKYKYLGFYTTRAEALAALAEYNGAPYDINRRQMTLGEVWAEWRPIHEEKVKSFKNYATAWKVIEPIQTSRMSDIKLRDVQKCFDESGKNTSSLKTAKTLVSMLWDYAAIHEIATKERRDLMTYLDVSGAGNERKVPRTVFTLEEREQLWNSLDEPIAVMALVLIYTGLRISELINLTEDDVDLARQSIEVRSAKTLNGIRTVPIADKIVPLLPRWFATRYKKTATVTVYYTSVLWPEGMQRLGMTHKSHDCRHTCTTLLTEAGVASEIRHAILGHSVRDVEERVYTHISLDVMLEAVNRIK